VLFHGRSVSAAMQRFGRYRGNSGHRATIENWLLMTQSARLLRHFGAVQRVQRSIVFVVLALRHCTFYNSLAEKLG